MRRIRHRERIHTAKGITEDEICESYSTETFDKIPIRKLLVANICPMTTHKCLLEYLSKFGCIINLILKNQKRSKNSYAFVTYDTVEAAQRTSQAARTRELWLNGQYLRVLPAASWHQPLDNDNCDKQDDECYDEMIATRTHITEQKNHINSLNDDCLMIIFNYLSITERVSAERVCKRWQIVSKESWILQKKLDLNPLKWGLQPFNFISAPHFIQIVNRCGRYLTHINIRKQNPLIGNMTLIQLSKLCSNLKSINIKGIHVKESGLRALAKNCCHIEHITFSFETWSPTYEKELILFFRSLKKLESLEIINRTSTFDTKTLLGVRAKSMKKLILTNFDSVNLLFGKSIPKMSNLKLLKLTEPDHLFRSTLSLSTEPFPHFAFKKCEVFELTSGNKFYFPSEKMVHLANCFCKLKKIKIDGIDFINDNFFNILSRNNQQITLAYIGNCREITNGGLACITSMSNLEHLIIDNLELVTDEVFVNMPNLKSLYCFNCKKVSDAGLIKLVALSQNINLINLAGCHLITNDFIYAAIEAMNCRKNNNTLELYVGRTAVDMKAIKKRSPLLSIYEDLFDLSRKNSIKKINKLYFTL